jgi:4-hydroxybenzoate polyprenyltransferase
MSIVQRLRLLVVLARPAVVMLVALYTAVGVAEGGDPNAGAPLAKALVAVVATLVFAVAVNDIADERIDRVNLPGDAGRPLVAKSGTRREMTIVAVTAAVVALAASTLLGLLGLLVIAGGLAFTAAYSLRPLRISERGVVAPLLLPLAYVAVPYLAGVFAVRASLTATDGLLLAGLYAGFVGRIVLKDFRDVKGDALFGKRTFLVRRGRRATCGFSAMFLVLGVATLPFVRDLTVALTLAYAVLVVATLVLLRALARSTSARRDATLIAAIAILGRGMLVTLYAHFAMLAAHWSVGATSAGVAALTLMTLGQARAMVRSAGPVSRLVVPAGLIPAPPAPACGRSEATDGAAWEPSSWLDTAPATR